MIHVTASLRVKDGCRDEYLAHFKENLPNVWAEDGCIEYVPCLDAETGWKVQSLDSNRVTVVEKWASMEALQAHARAPHMNEFRRKASHLVESTTLQVVEAA